MKIAFIVHDLTKKRGHDKYTFELAKRLSRKHEVHIFIFSIGAVDTSNMIIHKIPTISRPIILKTIFFYIFCGLLLKSIEKKKRFDVIHMQGICAPLIKKTIVTAHFCAQAYYDTCKKYVFSINPFIRKIYFILYSKLCIFMERAGYRNKNIGLVIAPTSKTKTELLNYYGINPERIVVLPEGVDPEEFRAKKPKDGQIEKLLFIGDVQRNNIIGLLEAIKQNKSVNLTIIGDIKTNLFKEKAEKLGIAERVIFMGPRENINELLNNYDLFIYPSLYDTFTLVALEAMACGLPCLLSSRAGICEIVKDGHNALIIDDPLDANEIKSKIEYLCSNPEIAVTLGQQARKTALIHSWEKVTARTQDAYRKVINQ